MPSTIPPAPFPRAFLSHSTADDRYVAELESFLRAAGYDDVFNDARSIEPDEQFWPKIQEGIAGSDALIVVITAASTTSTWVAREVEFARSLSKKIIPLWIEDCPVPAIFEGRDVIDLRPRTRGQRRTDISRVFKYAPAELIGREDEKRLISDAWGKVLRAEAGRPSVLTFVALGGEGKTSLVAKWLVEEMSAKGWPGCGAAFAWSFCSQGTRDQVAASSDLFLKEALTFFGDDAMANSSQGAYEKGRRLAQLIGGRRSLLILDGLEPLQYPPTSAAFSPGSLKDEGIAKLFKDLAANSAGLCVVTSRIGLPDLKAFRSQSVREIELKRLSRAHGVDLLKRLGVKGSERRTIPLKDGDEKCEMVNEFEKLVEDVKGHALTLTLLGSYLRDAHEGDIRKRDQVKLEEADAEEQGGHAFRVMKAYEEWLETGGAPSLARPEGPGTSMPSDARCSLENGQRALAILRLLGLFDRPMTADCFAALLKEPAIPGLTDPLVNAGEAQRNLAIKRLEDARLLTVTRGPSGTLVWFDAHPLLREYFAQQVQRGSAGVPRAAVGVAPTASKPQTSAAGESQLDEASRRDAGLGTRDACAPQTSDAWRAAHRRLYEHLCATTEEGNQPTLEDLQPLYQAVAHGCQAGLQQDAFEGVYFSRILRGALGPERFYNVNKLGGFGDNLGGLSYFYDKAWSIVHSSFEAALQGWLLAETAFSLRALGRLTDALEPMRLSLRIGVEAADWKNSAIRANNLSELALALGDVAGAVMDAEQSVTYADRSRDSFERWSDRTIHADTLHAAGRRTEAEARFREAEQMQKENQPAYPMLYSMGGFRYCDLLLAAPELAAWQRTLECGGLTPLSAGDLSPSNSDARPPSIEPLERGSAWPTRRPSAESGDKSPHSKVLRAVSQRAAQTLKWSEQSSGASLLDIVLEHLTLGRAALYAAILEGGAGSPLPAANNPTRSVAERCARSDAPYLETARRELDAALSGLRRSGQVYVLPRGLLTRAWLRFLDGKSTGPGSAQEDLDEAWEIAERGPMRPFMADILLHRARLFGSQKEECRTQKYPWQSPAADLAAAEKLIQSCGYHRRDEELADAKAALL